MTDNILLLTDSYKVSHARQYPPGTTKVYSYFESRGGKFPATVFFGLQYFIERYLEGRVVTQERIEEAANLFGLHFGNDSLFNRAGWEHILNDHDGRLPVSIRAVPEGTVVPVSNVLVTIENTCPECYWLSNYLETLLVQTWYPTTVATISHECRKVIDSYLMETAGSTAGAEFKLHDFGCRGVSSMESAGIGGAAHLVNFMGTDTVPALHVARHYYGSDIAGFSIPAAEHSTITSWGRDHEVDAYRNMLDTYPKGLVAVVSDSYDIYKACDNIWGESLKDRVLSRDGCLVIRPDSGTPEVVVPTILAILWQGFGGTVNTLGYKVLDPHVRVIQGDGVNYESIGTILEAVKQAGFSTENIAFGMGGALLQQLNRDTQRFAFKCSYIEVNGEGRDVYKQPATDPGKNSKRGRFSLLIDERGVPTTFPRLTGMEALRHDDLLVEVFRDGTVLRHDTLEAIRERVKQSRKPEVPLLA